MSCKGKQGTITVTSEGGGGDVLPDGRSRNDGDEDESGEAERMTRQKVENMLQEERVQLNLLKKNTQEDKQLITEIYEAKNASVGRHTHLHSKP